MKTSEKKILTFPIRLALIVLIIGALFKIMHWPNSKELMLIGALSVAVLYTIRFLNKAHKKTLDYIKLSLILLWLHNYFVQSFHLYKIPFLLEICFIILLIWWFAEEGFFYFLNRKFKKRGLLKITYYLLIGLTFFMLLFGILFKIQHWPYGSLVLLFGTLFLCLTLILDYFVIE